MSTKYQSNVDMTSKEDLLSEHGLKKKSKFFIFTLTTLSTLGGFLFGYDTGVVSGAMLLINKEFGTSPIWHELIVSSTIGAALVFSLFGGWFSDRYGRRMAILLSGIIFTIGSIIMGVASSKEILLVGRIVVGIAVGIESMSVPVYIAECAESSQRGMLVTAYQLFITLGLVAAGIIAGVFSTVDHGWRYMLGLAAVPSCVQFCGFLLMPESPRWLASQKRYGEANKVLKTIRGSATAAEQELAAVKVTIEDKERDVEEQVALNGGSSLIVQVFKSPSVRRALLIGVLLQAFQQLSGINTVMYYSASIIRMSGIRDESMAIWISAGVSAVNFICTFIGLFLVDRVGRRKLVLISYLGVITSLLLLGVGFKLMADDSPLVTAVQTDDTCAVSRTCQDCINAADRCGYCYSTFDNGSIADGSCYALKKDSDSPLDSSVCIDKTWASGWCPTKYFWLPILAMTLYLVSFAPGMGPMPWTINSEIYPLWARGFCTSITTSANWAGNLVISASFLSLIDALSNSGAFFLYVLIALVGFSFVFAFLPETQGRTLEEMESLFLGPWLVCCRGPGPGRRSGSTLGSNNVQKEKDIAQTEVNMSTSTHM